MKVAACAGLATSSRPNNKTAITARPKARVLALPADHTVSEKWSVLISSLLSSSPSILWHESERLYTGNWPDLLLQIGHLTKSKRAWWGEGRQRLDQRQLHLGGFLGQQGVKPQVRVFCNLRGQPHAVPRFAWRKEANVRAET